jgi:hypothetical protein
MSVRTTIAEPIPESSTAYLSLTLTDTDGVTPLANADSILISLTVTLFDEQMGTIVNSRTSQSIKNVNGGTVDSVGAVTLRLDPADTAQAGRHNAWRVASLVWTWGSPLKTGRHEVCFLVTNLTTV